MSKNKLKHPISCLILLHMHVYFLDLILLWPVAYFREIKSKTPRNQVLDQAFTPTNGPQAQPKSHAVATWRIRPVCACIRAVCSPSGKDLQKFR
jgi:hypothetical protein